MRNVYGFKDYKEYLKEAAQDRGVRAALARAASCQTAYVSQVLGGSAHFSLEQAEAISSFLGHGPGEMHYFLSLVQMNRAGTPALRAYFSRQLQQATEARLNLKDRLGIGQALTLEAQATYYSAWYYAAVHVLVSIPGFQTNATLARALALSPQKTAEVLNFLTSVGLVKAQENEFRTGTARIHLGHESPFISKHHINWRMQAVRCLDATGFRQELRDLHYSSVVSLSQNDVDALRTLFIEAIEKAKAVVKESKEETMYCLALDFFTLLQPH